MPRHANAGRRIAATKGTNHVRGQLWFALRIVRRTTVRDLMAVAEQDNRRYALKFLRMLSLAGFVRTIDRNPGTREPWTFVLIRDTGPKCPTILGRGKAVFDHNTDTEYRIDGN